MAVKRKPRKIEKEIIKVERYEYLLVEYLKEISNELTYLVLIVCSLFFFVLLDSPLLTGVSTAQNIEMLKIIFILMICGGFGLFGLSNITKRNIEKKFERMFT